MQKSFPLRLGFALSLIVLIGFSSQLAFGQGLAKTLFKDQVNGYKFRPPGRFMVVPSQDRMLERGVLVRMEDPEGSAYVEVLKFWDGMKRPDLEAKEREKAEEDAEKGRKKKKDEEDDGEDRSKVGHGRQTIEGYFKYRFGKSFKASRTDEDKKIKVKGTTGRYRVWKLKGFRVAVFSYPGPDADFHLTYYLPNRVSDSKQGKKWRSMFGKSGRSFEREKKMKAVDLSKLGYKDLLKYHQKADKQFKEWRVMGTPSKQFIIKTSSKRGAFIKNVITQLERSRKLFERDFPPAAFGTTIDAVSIVRICGTEEEFHRYGNTNRGVGGWFNPTTEELVLYAGEKDKSGDDLTMIVMTHEGFHQYCHFLFQQSEAHRWFDEGHGDYYAETEWFQGKPYTKARPETGWSRLPRAQRMARDGDMVPLEEHLNYSHGQWQRLSVRSYAQSWSIIYMLRQGALGKVPRKYWREEYGEIIPNYMSALLEGFTDEYARIRKKREEDAKEEGKELTLEEQKVNRFDISDTKKKKIWKKAMKSSWGKIDLDEFETNWLDYLENEFESE